MSSEMPAIEMVSTAAGISAAEQQLVQELQMIKGDKRHVLQLCRLDGTLLAAASRELRDDCEVVTAAVTQNGLSLKHASRRLRDDRSVCLAAVSSAAAASSATTTTGPGESESGDSGQNGLALRFCGRELRDDEAVVAAAVADDPRAFALASKGRRGDQKLALAAVGRRGSLLQHCSRELQGDASVVAVRKEDAEC
jgi:hypothetical protein